MTFKTLLAAGWSILLAHTLTAQHRTPLPTTVQEHLAIVAPQSLAQLNRLYQSRSPKGVEERGGVAQLDSAILFTNYSNNDSFPQTKSVFLYPNSKTAVQIDYDNIGGWQPSSRATQTTDNLGRTLDVFSEVYDATTGVWAPESRLESYPHGNSLTDVDSFFLSTWDPNTASWTIAIRNVTSYDDQDRPAVIFTELSEFFGQDFALLDELYYDPNNDNYLTIQSLRDQNAWTPFNRIESEFEQHREVLRTTYYIVDDVTFLPSNKEETTYDGAGNAVLKQVFDSDIATGGWTLTESVENEYDNNNRLIVMTGESFGPDAPPASRTEYGYYTPDGDELLVEIHSELDAAGQTWTVVDKLYYYYSNTTASPEVVNAGPLPLSPNPTTGLVRLPATGANARVTILNSQGVRLTPEQVRLNDGLIDLSQLPAGLYYISVQQGNQRQTGTVVLSR